VGAAEILKSVQTSLAQELQRVEDDDEVEFLDDIIAMVKIAVSKLSSAKDEL
jgi:hypothetical protein